MTVLEWLQRNPGEKYSIFVYKDYARTYVPYQQDYRRIYNYEIVKAHEIKSHKFVFDKKLLMMVLDKPTHHLYVKEVK